MRDDDLPEVNIELTDLTNLGNRDVERGDSAKSDDDEQSRIRAFFTRHPLAAGFSGAATLLAAAAGVGSYVASSMKQTDTEDHHSAVNLVSGTSQVRPSASIVSDDGRNPPSYGMAAGSVENSVIEHKPAGSSDLTGIPSYTPTGSDLTASVRQHRPVADSQAGASQAPNYGQANSAKPVAAHRIPVRVRRNSVNAGDVELFVDTKTNSLTASSGGDKETWTLSAFSAFVDAWMKMPPVGY